MAKNSERDKLEAMRHTAAHVLAAASRELKEETRLGIGLTKEDGFFQDIDVDERYTETDLARLQKKMEKIKSANLPIKQISMSKTEARKLYEKDPFKLELIDRVGGDQVGISDMGDGYFLNLCKGGHVESTGKIGHFKLTHLSGVYWRGDEKKPQLQRIFGVLFPTKEELEKHLELLEEAKKRDHRRLGKELDLFTFSPLVGAGLPMLTPRGAIIPRELENFVQSLQEPLGFKRVIIPHIAKRNLYETSGHWDKFQKDIFHVKGASNQEFVMKPMNCPHHTQIYAAQKRSYKDLPIKYSEVTMVYRDEQAGELQGLARVRAITQDDAHVFCRADQIKTEVKLMLKIVDAFYAAFDFALRPRLSLRDPEQSEKYLGGDKVWDKSEGTLREILKERGVDFEEELGEAAFYGPKIDFDAEDSLGRKWQLATVQLDFNMPERFGLKYTDKDGADKTPVMLHRAVMGAVERFMAILIEHYAGALPLWLSPTQVAVLPISDEQNNYANEVVGELEKAGLRAEIDERGESIGKKIREAEMMKAPVMLIVGKKEVEANKVAVRTRGEGDQGTKSVEQVTKDLKESITSKE